MTEGVKTVAYLGVALVISAFAWFTRPSDVEFQTRDEISKLQGTMLFKEFDNPANASGLEIVSVDETLGQLERFEVTRDARGLWTIPSHNAYPADAENQMRDVSVLFIDLPILAALDVSREKHAEYGVIEPAEGENAASEGVGRLVRITDKQDDTLVELVIGKPAKAKEGEFEGQYFVRKPNQDVVYVVALDPEKLSTKFEDWIEKDLLKLNAFDVAALEIEDYSVVGAIESDPSGRRFLRPQQNKRFEAQVAWNAEKGAWNLDEFTTFENGEPMDSSMPEGQQLNTTRLNELKNSLDDLKIIDVRRKPEGLGADLRAEANFMENMESLQSLVDVGFYPIPSASDDSLELRAANGEVHVAMKDGIEYILRFGNTAGVEESEEDESNKVNRYLFVTARFDESRIPMPAKPGEPTQPPADAAPSETPQQPAATDEPAGEPAPPADAPAEQPAAETPAEPANEEPAAEPAAEPPAEDSGAVSGPGGVQFVSTTDLQEPAADEEQPAEQPAAEQPPAEQPAEVPATEPPANEQPAAAQPAAEPAAPPAAGDEEAAAERERLEKDYQRQLDERAKKIEDAKRRVEELNDRFADWYYIISEDVYKKIHLTRDELFQDPKAQGAESDLPLELEEGGLPNIPGLPGAQP